MLCLIKKQRKPKMNNELTVVKVLLSNRSNQSDDLLSAATLAKTLKATLEGIFLEEEDLICAAGLCISSDISRWSAKESEISSDSVQRTLRTNAMHQKRQLKRIAEQEKIEFGFDVVRGDRYAWIFEAIKSPKILFVTHQNVSSESFYHLNRSLFNKSVASHTSKDPVKVVFNGSNASIKALKIAIEVALLKHRSLTVLLDADTFDSEIKLREELNSYLSKHLENHKSINVNAERINTQDQAKSLSQEVHMLIYPIDTHANDEYQLLHKLLRNLQSPLILVSE